MTCQEARELFSAKADDLLTAEQGAALNGHFATCPDCPREWERFERTVNLLRSVGEARAPAGFARRVIEAAGREPWPRRLLRGIFVPIRVKLPLEAAALVLVSTLVILLYRQTPEIQRAVEGPRAPAVTAPGPPPPAKSAEVKAPQRVVKAPAEPEGAPPASAPSPTPAEPERFGALKTFQEKDRPGKKEEAVQAEPPAVGGRTDVLSEAGKSLAPSSVEKLTARAQGPFHLIARLRPKSLESLQSQLNDLVKQAGGILVRDAEPMAVGSLVEVVVSRDAYPRLESGLRQIGDFSVETRAPNFPDQVRIALRIVH
jgi:hypothetical protein